MILANPSVTRHYTIRRHRGLCLKAHGIILRVPPRSPSYGQLGGGHPNNADERQVSRPDAHRHYPPLTVGAHDYIASVLRTPAPYNRCAPNQTPLILAVRLSKRTVERGGQAGRAEKLASNSTRLEAQGLGRSTGLLINGAHSTNLLFQSC